MKLGDLASFKEAVKKLGFAEKEEEVKLVKLKDKIGTDQSILNNYRRKVRKEKEIKINNLQSLF